MDKLTENASRAGRARAQRMTAEERSQSARTAALARWTQDLPKATHSGEVALGDIRIPCYVLEDGRRMLVQTAMVASLGMSFGGNPNHRLDRLANFVAGKLLRPFIPSDLRARIEKPFRFRTTAGTAALGYEATALADLCDAVLEARKAGALQVQQQHIATQCEVLMRAFSRVGIVALVDEATGYQADRARDALARILEKFVTDELRKWVKTFPSEFYQEMFRLKGWQYDPLKVERPGVVGHYTNDLVYERLAPGIREELHRLTPRDERGRLRHKLHQHLTEQVGHPKLREHLGSLVMAMRLSSSWDEFMRTVDRFHPRFGTTLLLPVSIEPQKTAP
jgi:hypothetical protein